METGGFLNMNLLSSSKVGLPRHHMEIHPIQWSCLREQSHGVVVGSLEIEAGIDSCHSRVR